MKSFYKIVAKILVITLLFVNQGMITFADSVDEVVETTINDETIEETINESEEEAIDEPEVEPEDENEEESEDEFEEEPEEEPEDEFEEEPEDEFEEEPEEEPEEESEEETEETEEENEEQDELVASESEIEEIEEEDKEQEETIASESEIDETEDGIEEIGDTIIEAAISDADPLGLVGLPLFGGTVDVDETIYLDFGHTPRFEHSTNWNGSDAITKFNENIDTDGNYKYDITGTVGSLIYDAFSSTTPPTQTTGAGVHVKLPNFTGVTAWTDFEFVGWLDKDGQNLMQSQGGNFKYAFQYGSGPAGSANDTYYTANWKQLENPHTIEIHYMRSTASEVSINNAYEFFNYRTVNAQHSKFLYDGIKNVPGYTPYKYIIIDESGNIIPDEIGGVTIDGRGLKTKDIYGNYFEYDPINDLKVNSEWALEGNMPNHDIKIYFFYEPDNAGKSVFEVNYQSMSGTEIYPSRTEPTLAESIIEAAPEDVANYKYKEVTVQTGGQSLTTGLYTLGQLEFSLPDQIINPSGNPGGQEPPYGDLGKFKAKMPNQDVKIVYKYEMLDGYDDIVFNVGKEQPDGTIATESETRHTHVSSTERGEFVIHNLENQGYGAPVITPYDVATEAFEYQGGIGGAYSTLRYYLTDFGDCRVDITYTYDYTSAYWTKISFNTQSRAEGGHGDIAAAPGSKSLDKRFFKRGGIDQAIESYTVETLSQNVDVTADTYYLAKWYECSASLTPTGPELSMSDIIQFNSDKSQYGFFVAFEEDPAWWRDIYYEAASNCSLDGISSTHITKDALKVNISSPSVIAAAGYKWDGAVCVDATTRKYVGGIWLDEDGNLMPDNFSTVLATDLSKNYHPSIVVDANPYEGAVKPISSLVITADGKGIARPFGLYSDRYYVLADASDKVIESRPGIGFPTTGFENLMPGHSYHIYEVKNQSDVPTVGSQIAPAGSGTSATISAYFEVNIPALSNNYTVSPDGKSITINQISGLQYALLKTDRTIAKNFGETFTNLDEAPYYIVVARSSGETTSATDQNVVKNGVPVYTNQHDLTGREYKLVVMGSGVGVTGKSGTNVNTSAGSGKVYKITAGTEVELSGQTGKSWEVITNNTNLTSYTSIKPHLTMPNEDVVVRNYTPINSDTTNYSVAMSGSSGVGLANKETFANYLQTDTNAVQKASQGLKVVHNIVLKKTCALSDISGKLTPYEYSLDVGMSIQGSPYPYTSVDPLGTVANLYSFISYDKGIQGNNGFSSSGTLEDPYTESDEKLKGSGIITLEAAKKFGYKQIQKVVIKSSIDTTFNKTLYVDFGSLINTASNYSEISGRLTDYWVPENPTVGSTFNDVEYLYDKVITDDTAATPIELSTEIKCDYNLKILHNINQEREDDKILLRDELIAADTKLGTLTSAIAIASLSNAIGDDSSGATQVKNHQRDYTVAQIYDAYLTLKDAVDNAFDPPSPPGTVITIVINANGGTANITEILATVGEQYTELSNVTVSRSGYNFSRWSTSADGSGTTISSDMTVSADGYPTELFAIWTQGSTYHGGGGSGGGGGGGGGRSHVAPNYSESPVLQQNFDVRAFDKNMHNTVLGNSFYFKDKENFILYYEYDPTVNIFTLSLKNILNGEKTANQWAVIGRDINNDEINCAYNFDENGCARTGFYTEGNDVYYLDRNAGDYYGALKVGWIFDPLLGSYYYASPQTGALCTGWTNIEGKDYYFEDIKAYDANGKFDINNSNIANGYGRMLSSCMTPDGYMVGADGARIVETPNQYFNFN